jgi:glutaredoxin
MKLYFFHSSLCPRCRHAKKILTEQTATHDGLEVEEIDVARQPTRAMKEKVFMIPTIMAPNGYRKSFLVPTEKKIIHFLELLKNKPS